MVFVLFLFFCSGHAVLVFESIPMYIRLETLIFIFFVLFLLCFVVLLF